MIDPHAYNITVRRSDFEGEICFEARVKEFPDLAEYGDSFQEAYELAIDAIQATVKIFSEKGKAIPAPQEIPDEYSGRVTLRLPRTLHRALAESADDQGISLNQHLVHILAYFSGFAAGVVRVSGGSDWHTMIDSSVGKTSTAPNIKLVYSNKLNQRVEWRKTA